MKGGIRDVTGKEKESNTSEKDRDIPIWLLIPSLKTQRGKLIITNFLPKIPAPPNSNLQDRTSNKFLVSILIKNSF